MVLVLPNGTMSASALLQPGVYRLTTSVDGGSDGEFGANSNVVDFTLYLDASFTPVPEPRWALLAALLATMLGGYVVSRGRRAS